MNHWVLMPALCISVACAHESEQGRHGRVDTVMVFTQTPGPSNRDSVSTVRDSSIAHIDSAEQSSGTRFAIFSSLRYVEETGDAVGQELELWGDSTHPRGRYREAEGSLGCTHTIALRIQNDSIQFEHPQYGTFHGFISGDTIRGRFPGEVIEDTLLRVSEPYRETKPCRR